MTHSARHWPTHPRICPTLLDAEAGCAAPHSPEMASEGDALPRLLSELGAILVVLNSDRSLQSILDYLVSEARGLLEAQACVLYHRDPDGRRVVIEAQSGLAGGWSAPMELPLTTDGGLGHPSLDAWILGAAPMVFSELADADLSTMDGDVPVGDTAGAWYRTLAGPYRTLLSVPLVIKDATYGSLGFYYEAERQLSPAAVSLAVTFGSQVALAIENARLRLQAEQAAILQERSRLARDLHDSVTQSLYSLILVVEATRRLAEAGDLSQVQQAIARVGEIGQQTLREMRLLVYELRPSVLRREGLIRALGQRLETVERRAGVTAQLVVEGQPDLSPALEEQLYHLIQEALNNALKHAVASTVTVHLSYCDDESTDHRTLQVIVRDNGIGFDLAAAAEGGIGLTSMRERTERLGGQLRIDTSPGQGTSVGVTLTLPPSEHASSGDESVAGAMVCGAGAHLQPRERYG
jgi:signal transduction histidine kinase